MAAPINVKLENPTIRVADWLQQAQDWRYINKHEAVGGNQDFYPLTIKAAYVIGVIYGICESVTQLLSHPMAKTITYLPACGVFSSGIELLGRCINGNEDHRNTTEDLKTGFKWLKDSNYQTVLDTGILITTSIPHSYTIDDLVALRHFAAHGQATSRRTATEYKLRAVDYEILEKMPPLVAGGVERYWDALINDETACNNLAKADIIRLRYWPVRQTWQLFEWDPLLRRYPAISEQFEHFNWHLP